MEDSVTLAPMRVLPCLLVLCVSSAAWADSFVEIAGGLTTPLGDQDWTDSVESSPKVAVRLGAFPNEVGGFLSVDWTPYQTDADGAWGAEVSAHRFRLMGGVMFHHMVSNTLVVSGRGSVGADIAHANARIPIFNIEVSDTDTALGFEMGVGLFFKTGRMELGGEVAIPIAIHDHAGGMDRIQMQYTSYDLDLLFCVRFLQ